MLPGLINCCIVSRRLTIYATSTRIFPELVIYLTVSLSAGTGSRLNSLPA